MKNFVNGLENLWIALVLTGYNIVLFALYPSLFLWISSLFTVCMILWLATVYENKLTVYGIKKPEVEA